jgi:hypothetical protein
VLQPGHRGAERQRHVIVDVARHLAKLHQHAFHRAQLFSDVVGGPKSEVVTELVPTVD